MRLIQYNENHYESIESASFQDLIKGIKPGMVNWLDVDIKRERTEIELLSSSLGLHHLTLDDILNVNHLPKFELFDNYLFLTFKMMDLVPGTNIVRVEHLSMILADDFVLLVQEDCSDDVFDDLRTRIVERIGRIRSNGNDYLFYRIVDTIVDNYFRTLESIREQVDDLEDEVLKTNHKDFVSEILSLKAEIREIRKVILPLREEIGRLRNDSSQFIHKSTRVYFRDLHDNLSLLANNFEYFREMIKDLTDLHLGTLSYDMNQVMKTLTVISALFIPLTFIVGVYGMNFKYMPELEIAWFYPAVMGFMLTLSIAMVVYMKRKRWW